MKVLVVIPTYQESIAIREIIPALLDAEPEIDILVVDDNSPDGTAQIVTQLSQGNPRIYLLERQSKEGLGLAYLAGFEWGFARGYEFIVEMDADGSHRPEDLGVLLAARGSADLVIGSRWVSGGSVKNWPAARRLISRIGNLYAKLMLGTRIHDMTSGFRVFRASFLKQLVAEPVSSHGYSFQVELAYRASKKGVVIERPITFVERVNGESKMTLAIVLEALTKVTFWGLKRLF